MLYEVRVPNRTGVFKDTGLTNVLNAIFDTDLIRMNILATLIDACDDPQLVKHYYLVCKQI